MKYTLKDGKEVTLNYGRKEMLSIIHEKTEDYDGVKELPQVISDMVSGRQEGYVKAYFDSVFSGNGTMSSMRFSVYCSDKTAFEDPAIIKQQAIVMPWLAGFTLQALIQRHTPSLFPEQPTTAIHKTPSWPVAEFFGRRRLHRQLL